MKLRWTAALLAATTIGTAMAQTAAPAPDKNKLSYAIGYQIGRDFSERNLDVDIETVIRAIRDGQAKREPTVAVADMEAALNAMQKKMAEQARAEFEKVSAENKQKSDAFLAQNKTKTGVQVLSSGIQYRVIETGSGAKPTANSKVSVHLRGSISTGQEFASTYQANKPLELTVGEAPMPGLRTVLPMMTVGSRWEVFLPPDQAYGNDPRAPIGPNQAVVLDLKLVSVQ
jgi:FKBP-type peptidyl-prolyl cis-trans isomerase